MTPPAESSLAGRSIIVGTRPVRGVFRKVVEQGDVTDDLDDVKHEFRDMRRAQLGRFTGAAGDRREDGSGPSAGPGTVSSSDSALQPDSLQGAHRTVPAPLLFRIPVERSRNYGLRRRTRSIMPGAACHLPNALILRGGGSAAPAWALLCTKRRPNYGGFRTTTRSGCL